MDHEEFCDKYCPMPFRGTFRNGEQEVDCDTYKDTSVSPPVNTCPFGSVDFSKVIPHKNSDWEVRVVRIGK